MNISFQGKEPKFEDIYPKAPFSELIRLSISLAMTVRKAASKARQLRWHLFRRVSGQPDTNAVGG